MSMLQTRVGSLMWPTPVALASGTCGFGQELDCMIDWQAVGAIFTKGLSLLPRAGHQGARIYETESGMLNAIGLENVGFERFVSEKMPFLRQYRAMHGGCVIVNLFGTSLEEYQTLAQYLDAIDGVDGVEINLSCPNVKEGGLQFGRNPDHCAAVTHAVRQATSKWVGVKLSPVGYPPDLAQAAADAGADAVCMGNTMPALALDIERRTSQLAAGTGGLSGPALRPIQLAWVQQIAQRVHIPIVGIGGIAQGEHAIEYLLAGATAVQVGTATFADPNTAKSVCDGLLAYIKRHDFKHTKEICGLYQSYR